MIGKLCTLHYAVGNLERCPGSRCSLWIDRDGSGCVLEAVEHELTSAPSLAGYLLDLKLELEHARAAAGDTETRSLFHRLLNDEQAAEGEELPTQ